ncbi:MAG: hypothetical protein LBK66_01890 [Spirochaetaceae bacterium]|jgi:hypothetical protein|nr:hypothetical protein [Spirochaetaceae bacterium]
MGLLNILNNKIKQDNLRVSLRKITDSSISKASSKNIIDPEDVIKWLMTQPNAYGKLYLENVALQYMHALRVAPKKFEISDVAINRNVFTCKTPDELKDFWDTCKAAPNYKQVNMGTSGAFSAGMNCLLKYLKHLYVYEKQTTLHKAGVPAKQKKAIIERLTSLLKAHYSNGYRINSPIEMTRLRGFAAAEYGEELKLSDDELKRYIRSCGIELNNKVFIVSAETKERLKTIANDYFESGAQAIFYEEFFNKNEKWLIEASVVTEDILLRVFAWIYLEMAFTKIFFGTTHDTVETVIKNEICRIWGDGVLINYNQITERLSYIPFARIKHTLASNQEFIWNSEGTYTHVNKVIISKDEKEAVSRAAKKGCAVYGYVSVNNLPLLEIAERNYELSVSAIQSAVYSICLSDEYDKKGKIIVKKGKTLNALEIMKAYCVNLDKCTLDDLLQYEEEITGEIRRFLSMEAAFSTMVRIDKATFVADKYIAFNKTKVDKAISKFVTGDYLPLKSFTTFGAFPDCGQRWNLFLLESYCRRFSKQFRFDTPSVNSQNAGAVVRKSCELSYTEIMADAVIHAKIPLSEERIAVFLFEAGYTGRSASAKVNVVIETAKALQRRKV